MSSLQDRQKEALEKGPGKKRGWLRSLTPEEELFEISIPFEEGFRKSGYYIRIVTEDKKVSASIYEAGETDLPKTAFHTVEDFLPKQPFTATELEVKIATLLHGRT